MKIILSIIFAILIMMLTVNTYAAELKGTAVPIETEFANLTKLHDEYYLFTYEGKEYYFNRSDNIIPRYYNETEFNFFIKEKGLSEYEKIKDGLYMAVYRCAPYKKVFIAGDSYKGYSDFRLEFYDADFNFIKSIKSYSYITSFGYVDNKYYYRTLGGDSKTYVSEDMDNWNLGTVSSKPSQISSDNTYLGTNDYEKVSLNNIDIFYDIEYEGLLNWGIWDPTHLPIFFKNSRENPYRHYFLSFDGINFIELLFDEIEELRQYGNDYPIYRWYATDNYFVIETETQRITVPMNEIRQELDKLKSAPYINLNGKILSFEVPPTIVDDRTLVPMRFLFEQMDATVEWEAETQTATVYKEDDIISFSIDDTDANVNNAVKAMEVPARLINGKTMIPLRFLSEELGYTVDWNNDLRMVTITE